MGVSIRPIMRQNKIFLVSLAHLYSVVVSNSSDVITSNSGSSKKGLCVSKKNFDCRDLALFPNISWYYNWGSEYHGQSCSNPPAPLGYIPMVWGYWGSVPTNIPTTHPLILGFNEPDHENQANMSPGRALEGWLLLQEAYPDRQLVSPGTSLKPDGEMVWIDDLYKRHGKKIWLTEFAMSGTSNAGKVLEFMQDILPMLEAHEGVYKYSWF